LDRNGFALLTLALVVGGSNALLLQAQVREMQVSAVSMTGRVVESDGRPVQTAMQVDFVCGGRIQQKTLTAPDGTFFFDLSRSRDESWLDPGVGATAGGTIEGNVEVADSPTRLDQVPSMGRGRVSLSGCEVRVAPQPGVASNPIRLGTRGALENPDIGVIVIQRLKSPGAMVVSLSTLAAPRKALEAYQKAEAELGSANPDFRKAVKQLDKAVREYPGFAAAWDLLARAHLSLGNGVEGKKCFKRAVDVEPKFISPYLGLAQLAVQQNAWSEVAEWTEKVLELDDRQFQALYWSGLAGFYLNRFDAAEKALSSLYSREAAAMFPFGLLPLGAVYANNGRIADAARCFRQYLDLMPPSEVPESQRLELERQMGSWEKEGLLLEKDTDPNAGRKPETSEKKP